MADASAVITTEMIMKETAEIVFRQAAIWQAVEPVLKLWIEKHGYFYSQRSMGEYVALRADEGHQGMHLEGRDTWPAYHEMLADLLTRIDAKAKSQSESLKTVSPSVLYDEIYWREKDGEISFTLRYPLAGRFDGVPEVSIIDNAITFRPQELIGNLPNGLLPDKSGYRFELLERDGGLPIVIAMHEGYPDAEEGSRMQGSILYPFYVNGIGAS